MPIRQRKLEGIIGQQAPKSLLLNFIQNNQIPDFLIFSGDTGSGKTTLAEWFALACTCTHSYLDPCCECDTCKDNLQGLESGQGSRLIKKINLGEICGKADLKEALNEAFNFQPIPNKHTFYILEEIQELGEEQGILMEKLEHIPRGVHILACTTEIYKLRQTIRNRAAIPLTFVKLSTKECMLLVDNLCRDLNIRLSPEDAKYLVQATRHNARAITNCLNTVKDMQDIHQAIRNAYQSIEVSVYTSFLELLFSDFTNFLLGVDVLESSSNLSVFWYGLSTFIRDAIFFYYAGADNYFSKEEQVIISKCFKELSEPKVKQIFKLSKTYCRSDEDIEYQLILMNEIANASEVKLQYIPSKSDSEVNKKNTVALKQSFEDDTNKQERKLVKGLSLSSVMDIKGTQKVFVQK